MKYIRLIIGTLLLLSFATACKPQAKANGEAAFVVLSPEVAEILSALGAEELISGVAVECDYPPSLKAKPIVGNFGAIDKEKVLALNPKIVFTSALEQDAIANDLKKLGIEVVTSYPKSIAELFAEIGRLGSIIGKEKEATLLTEELKGELAEIKARALGKKVPKVYLEIYRDPLMSVADNSFVGELIETAGGDNIFERLERDYARVNPEEVIRQNPDIMICYSRDTRENILKRKGWQDIPAIKAGRIYFEEDISPDLIQRATPRSFKGMKQLAELYRKWAEETN